MNLSPKLKCLLLSVLLVGSMLTLATYFAAMMYLRSENSLFSADSELCMWYSLAQDVIRTFPHCGLIRLNDSRGVVELLLNVLAVLVGGISVWKAMWTYAFFSSFTSIGIAALISLRQENGRFGFSVMSFVTACLLQASFYFLNVGHEASYALAVLCMWSFVWEFKHKWVQHCLLVLISVLGVVNDDMFCVVFVCPIIALFMLRIVVGGVADWRMASVVVGALGGFVLLKCLRMFDVVWWPQSALALTRPNDLGQWASDMMSAYGTMFRMNS